MEETKNKHPNHGDTMDSMNPFDSGLEEETFEEFDNSQDESYSVLEDAVLEEPCPNCSGTGRDPMDDDSVLDCELCGGSGHIEYEDPNQDVDVTDYFQEDED